MIDEVVKITALVQNGKPQLSDYQKERVNKKYSSLEGKFVQIAVKQHRNDRSERQRKYYWGVIVKYICDYTGDTPEATNEYLKWMCLPRQFTKFNGMDVPMEKTTKILNTIQSEEFHERCRVEAAKMGIIIPLPNEADV